MVPYKVSGVANTVKSTYSDQEKQMNRDEINLSRRDASFAEVLPQQILTAMSRVNRPMIFDQLVDGGHTLIIMCAGRSRVGVIKKFTELAREINPDVNITSNTTFTAGDYSGSFFVFNHKQNNPQLLKDFAMQLREKFQDAAFTLPTPSFTEEFALSVRAFPDKEGQLNAICNRLLELNPKINITALLGRKVLDPKADPDDKPRFFAQLDFVLGFPEELKGCESVVQREIEELGRRRGEDWKVGIQPFVDDPDKFNPTLFKILAGSEDAFPASSNGTHNEHRASPKVKRSFPI
jgi:hypothetical protein